MPCGTSSDRLILYRPVMATNMLNGQKVPEDVSTVPVCIVQVKCSISEAFDPGCPTKRISLPVLGQQGSWLQLWSSNSNSSISRGSNLA